MNQPYRVFQILPAPLDGRVYLIVDGTGDPAIVLQKILFHLSAPKASDPFRLEPVILHQAIWDGALEQALKLLRKEGLDEKNCEAYCEIQKLRFECDSPSSSSQSSSSPSFSSDVEAMREKPVNPDVAKGKPYHGLTPPPGSYHGLERKEVGGDPMAHRPPTPPSDQK
jgi:hypothetical protein